MVRKYFFQKKFHLIFLHDCAKKCQKEADILQYFFFKIKILLSIIVGKKCVFSFQNYTSIWSIFFTQVRFQTKVKNEPSKKNSSIKISQKVNTRFSPILSGTFLIIFWYIFTLLYRQKKSIFFATITKAKFGSKKSKIKKKTDLLQ